jgi:hypothetical protein
MNEHLLQYIWMHRLYDAKQLETTDRQSITVIHPGQLNKDQGPDFLHARIRINHVELIGSVEIHTHTSHWHHHGHTGDAHYKNVVLHVVWEHDVEFHLPIPILILKGRIPAVFLQNYAYLFRKADTIPCASLIKDVSDLTISKWKERMMAERLMMKDNEIQKRLLPARQNDEEVFWLFIFRTMGLPVNADAFEAIFGSISFRLLRQCSQRILVMEALLLGQAGLLEDDFEDDYLIMLQREYHYLKRKYRIQKPALLLSHLRMRPAHFPAIRLAQIAMLMFMKRDLFKEIVMIDEVEKMKKQLTIVANDFWHHHYSLKHKSLLREKQIGDLMADMILINTILPFRYLIGVRQKNETVQMKIFDLYMQIKAEENKIVNEWKRLGIGIKNAFDTQALLHLKKNYCLHNRCLECAIGNHILKTD